MKSFALSICALGVLALVSAHSYSPPPAGANTLASGYGVLDVGGGKAVVEVFVAVGPGRSVAADVQAAVEAQGARPIDSAEFATSGLVWDQFDDASNTNDFVTQYYNAANEIAGGLTALTNTQATWTGVPSSSFAFEYGGATSRCPSLVRQCPGPQIFDSFNDVGWADLGRCRASCTLGVTWYSTSTDEADIALNFRAKWRTDGSDIDVESVMLHENGHALGLGHSSVQAAVMYAYYQGVRRSLHQDDIDGVSALYP